MRLNKSQQKAGVVKINAFEPNTNGSWNCVVDLTKVRSDLNMRKKDKKHVAQIVANFHEASLRNPAVVYYQGRLQSIDGQHELEVAALVGYETMTCEIHFNMSPQEAAKMFYHTNAGRKRMDEHANYRAAVRANEAWAKGVEKGITSNGYASPLEHGNKSDLPHIGPLKDAWERKQLQRVLLVLEVWWDWDQHMLPRAAAGCAFLRGMLAFLVQYHDADVETIKESLSEVTPEELKRAAGKMAWKKGIRSPERAQYRSLFERYYLLYTGEDRRMAA